MDYISPYAPAAAIGALILYAIIDYLVYVIKERRKKKRGKKV